MRLPRRSLGSRPATTACPSRRTRYDLTPAGSSLPAGPLRHPGGRRDQLAADDRWPSRRASLAVARRASRAAGEDARRDPGVRRQRPRPALAAPGEPALVARGGGHRRVDRHPAGAVCSTRPASRRTRSRCVFRGLDRGVEGGEVQHYERSLSLAEARREEVLLAYAMNGEPLPPQHGFPAAARGAGLVRDDERQVAAVGSRCSIGRSTATSRRAAIECARRPMSRASRCRGWCRGR